MGIIEADLVATLRAEVEASKKALAPVKASFSKKDKRRNNKIRNLASSKRSLGKNNRLQASLQRERDTARTHLAALRLEQAKQNFMKKARSKHSHRCILNVPGKYRLAMKRNVGHIGQQALAKVVEQNVKRWVVTRSELLLGLYFTSASKLWYADKKGLIKDVVAKARSIK
jgi:hypothetical protein